MTLKHVWMELNGTLMDVNNITVDDQGKLYVWAHACTENYVKGKYDALRSWRRQSLIGCL